MRLCSLIGSNDSDCCTLNTDSGQPSLKVTLLFPRREVRQRSVAVRYSRTCGQHRSIVSIRSKLIERRLAILAQAIFLVEVVGIAPAVASDADDVSDRIVVISHQRAHDRWHASSL